MGKKILLTMGIVFLILLQCSSSNAQTSNDLLKLQALIKQVVPDIQIEQWNVLIREDLQKSKDDILNKIKDKYKNITVLSNEKSTIAIVKNSTNGLSIEFTIIPIHKNDKNETILIERIFSENEKLVNPKFLQSSLNSIGFTRESKIFYCLKGSINGNMNSDLPYICEDFLEVFRANLVDKVSENGFISMSARSRYFNGDLANHMNVQMALHYSSNGNQTILTIGTPIITVEY